MIKSSRASIEKIKQANQAALKELRQRQLNSSQAKNTLDELRKFKENPL